MITALAASIFLTAAAPAPPPCRFAGEPRAWTSQALASWDRLDHERLRIADPVTPVITLFDATCAWTLTPDARGDFRVGARRYRATGAAHSGQVGLPDGGAVPARKLAFASPMSDGRMFFIMALPSVWRADDSEPRDWRRLSMVVFMHEFAHTQQAASLGVRIDDLLARGLPEDSDDDVIQDRFGGQPDYRTAYEGERDLFYRAAAARDAGMARFNLALAAHAMEARREQWFRGEDALYAEADDVFLTLEGTGNWAAWMWLTDPRGGRLSPSDATTFVRGGGAHWSQDEGLGVILAVDRLTPDWPALAFAPRGATANRLIERALAQ
ncbi:hypothetical protein GCM10007859_14700 [Brevundimonas denitrificans]|uniref:Uncharacterized protein n=1 Tax=Brevundimonas denitrificans TaxID=1443434 RepID=A0ABQ6BHD5_9CAUL|nr:hypothetical protein [Brevundimonas denitrificans]GLS01455.1 hypothetical protein GCM10007859_14700 [Brevundimonas denitrificans]